ICGRYQARMARLYIARPSWPERPSCHNTLLHPRRPPALENSSPRITFKRPPPAACGLASLHQRTRRKNTPMSRLPSWAFGQANRAPLAATLLAGILALAVGFAAPTIAAAQEVDEPAADAPADPAAPSTPAPAGDASVRDAQAGTPEAPQISYLAWVVDAMG